MRKLIYGTMLAIGLAGAFTSASFVNANAKGECPPCPSCPGVPEKAKAVVQVESEDSCCPIADKNCDKKNK